MWAGTLKGNSRQASSNTLTEVHFGKNLLLLRNQELYPEISRDSLGFPSSHQTKQRTHWGARDCNGLHAPSLSCSQTNAVRSWSSNFECSPCQVMPTAFAILSRDQLHKKKTSCHHVGWKTVESTGYRLLKAPSIVWCLVNAQCVSMFSSTYRSGAKEYTSTQSVLWNR